MIKYHTITIDDYNEDGQNDSFSVDIKARVNKIEPEPEVGIYGGYDVGNINWNTGDYTKRGNQLISDHILEHEDRLKEILASK